MPSGILMGVRVEPRLAELRQFYSRMQVTVPARRPGIPGVLESNKVQRNGDV